MDCISAHRRKGERTAIEKGKFIDDEETQETTY